MKEKKRILVLAKTLPLHDRASGDYRLFQILDILRDEYDIDFLSTTHTAWHIKEKRLDYIVRDSSFNLSKVNFLDQKYIDDLRSININALNFAEPVPFTIRPTNDYDIRPFLSQKVYDMIWVEFFYLMDQYIDQIRQYQPWAKVVCDSVDLHFRRLARQANYLESEVRFLVNTKHEKKKPKLSAHKQKVLDHRTYADHVREHELKVYEKCDAVVVVSEDDKNELKKHCPNLETLFIPNIHRMPEHKKASLPKFEERNGCIFIGNFDHNPNVSSAIFLKHEVAPFLANTNIPISLVGSNPPKIVRTIGKFGAHKEMFKVTGYVPSTKPYLDSARISIAPILFGAGMNGKIGEALAYGVPVVTTHLGALGMGLTNEENCLVADTAEDFANAIKRLHTDKPLWNKLHKNGKSYVEKRFSKNYLQQIVLSEMKKIASPLKKIEYTLVKRDHEISLDAPSFEKPDKNPDFSVIVLTFNQWAFTELCLRSLSHAAKLHPEIKAEYILVDNNSTDGTADKAGLIKNLKVIRNKENLGFAKGNNVGIRAARGKNIVILNNDTIVPPHWLNCFEKHLQHIDRLGILGPSANTESGQALFKPSYNGLREFFQYNEKLESENQGSWERVKKISGLCMVLPRATIEKVGLFGEEFGIGYFEDDDLCLRTEDLGLKLVWAKDIYVHHFGSMSFEGNLFKRDDFLEDGMSRFAFKWGKRGLDHIAKAHKETLLRLRAPKQRFF
ncbi:MAG: glycosyltransferase [Oligoflexia bacterium]|nr:glycosyltransferase [Oligoflexia bacterium]